jgi:hypothetical protein
MTKVLRLHQGGANTLGNWDSSVRMQKNQINTIVDPIGANNNYEITSIPSPFARMDLVKRAFEIVANDNLDGNSAYHKLVSDCLDVGQIFFNIEKYRDDIEIIEWDRNTALSQLSNSNSEHKRLSQTYDTYLVQDATEYNFANMNSLYLLNYIGPKAPGEMNIIGATSPATLFFTPANNLEYVGEKIQFGNDKPFDSDYMSLYKRDIEYIKYWWALRNNITNFAILFPEVDLYLSKSFNLLDDEKKNILRQIDSNTYSNNYDYISVQPESQQYVTILGNELRRKASATHISSGFEMKISQSLKNGVTPLALPVHLYTESTHYVEDIWNKNTKVPYNESRPINSRTLPGDGTKYPFVTIGDFLEDTIIEVPYKINSVAFFDGNEKNPEENKSYILPIKKIYFNYFTVQDLMGKVSGKDCVEIEHIGTKPKTSIKVTLRIPILNNKYVQYERIYYRDGNIDKELNKGVIKTKEFTLGAYPNIKYSDQIKPYYRIALLDRDSKENDNSAYMLSFYNNSNVEVIPDAVVRRNRNADNSRFDKFFIDSATYVLSSDYQYISLSSDDEDDIKGIIVPKFVSKSGGHKFRFAIDFGTSNTHIEYSINDESTSRAFDIKEDETQIQKLHITSDYDINNVFNSDFIPETIGGDSLYRYPMRTVISESNNTNWDTAVMSMANVNIPYTYEKRKSIPYNNIYTNLKWSIDPIDQNRARKYIENILLMLRNKVLLNNGDLAKTEIVWFYPASMTQNRFNKFKQEWDTSFTSLFSAPKSNIIAISESIAPYYYHKSKKGATSSVVSIDIGGGTTDVLIVDKGEPKYLTSFRFAANAIFGDGYSYDSETNGFVNNYKDKILNQLASNSLVDLEGVFKSVLDKHNSTNIIAFLFSLSSNNEVSRKNVEINFMEMLANDNRGKYVIVLFYVALIYHIAKLMKAKGIDMPRHITFSGNGSRILNILSTNDVTLVNFTKKIFEKIYDIAYNDDGLDIIRPENSKESTCKGAFSLKEYVSQDYSLIKEMKTILLGTNSESFADVQIKYNDIKDTDLNSVVEEVKKYIEFTFNLDNEFSFYDNFDIDRSIMQKVKDICKKDIKTYLETGLSNKKDEISKDGADENLEETLFFYPLVGIINAVVRNIYNM